MWAETKREVEESDGDLDKHYLRDTREDYHRRDDEDLKQEIKFLKESLKHQKYREEDMEDKMDDLEYKNEKLEREIYYLEKQCEDFQYIYRRKRRLKKSWKYWS